MIKYSTKRCPGARASSWVSRGSGVPGPGCPGRPGVLSAPAASTKSKGSLHLGRRPGFARSQQPTVSLCPGRPPGVSIFEDEVLSRQYKDIDSPPLATQHHVQHQLEYRTAAMTFGSSKGLCVLERSLRVEDSSLQAFSPPSSLQGQKKQENLFKRNTKQLQTVESC